MDELFSDFQKHPEFDNHQSIIPLNFQKHGLEGFIVIHRNNLNLPSFGATRLWQYENINDALTDALQLSRIMSYKSTLAGLPYGGAKAVLLTPKNLDFLKSDLLGTYIKQVNFLNGKFVTGADVGIDTADLNLMAEASNFIVGIKADAITFTAIGIYYAMQVAAKEYFGTEDLTGRTFAIQGLGKIGTAILRLVYPLAQKIYVSDINQQRVDQITEEFPGVMPVTPQDIYKLKVDFFVPCALSNTINSKTVEELRTNIIAGSANAQLETSKHGELLHQKGILYTPDYIVNAGGFIAVVDEYEHKNTNEQRVQNKVKKIKNTLKTVIDKSKKTNKPVSTVADEIAKSRIK